MADGSFWHVLLTLGGVVLPLLLAWLLIGLGARRRPHRHGSRQSSRRPRR